MVLEYPDRFELIFLDELTELLEILFCFSRKSDNERCADEGIGKCRTNRIQKSENMFLIVVSTHKFQYILTDMLEGNIEIWEEVLQLGELREVVEREDIRIEVVDAESSPPVKGGGRRPRGCIFRNQTLLSLRDILP